MCVTRDVLHSENSNFVMSRLSGDTCYRIELRAHNAIGFSQATSLLMRTALGESADELGTFTYDMADPARAGAFGGDSASAAGAAAAAPALLLALLIAGAVCFVLTQ